MYAGMRNTFKYHPNTFLFGASMAFNMQNQFGDEMFYIDEFEEKKYTGSENFIGMMMHI